MKKDIAGVKYLTEVCNNKLTLVLFLFEFPFVVPLSREHTCPQVVLPYVNIDGWEEARPKTRNYQRRVEPIAPLTSEQRELIDRELQANFRWNYRIGTRNSAN